jgi:hypothetical protein
MKDYHHKYGQWNLEETLRLPELIKLLLIVRRLIAGHYIEKMNPKSLHLLALWIMIGSTKALCYQNCIKYFSNCKNITKAWIISPYFHLVCV